MPFIKIDELMHSVQNDFSYAKYHCRWDVIDAIIKSVVEVMLVHLTF